jgi:hypothetical protein
MFENFWFTLAESEVEQVACFIIDNQDSSKFILTIPWMEKINPGLNFCPKLKFSWTDISFIQTSLRSTPAVLLMGDPLNTL